MFKLYYFILRINTNNKQVKENNKLEKDREDRR